VHAYLSLARRSHAHAGCCGAASRPVSSKPFHRLQTLHAIISFVFNTAVLALTINLAVSLI